MPNSMRAKLTENLLRQTFRPFFSPKVPVRVQRMMTRAMELTALVPRGVHVSAYQSGGVKGEQLLPDHPASNHHAILYLHGGGYVVCSPATHRAFTSRLCKATGLPVYVPRYRLAPEHPYPAQLEDAYAAICDLEASGFQISNLIVAGDSAGGNLTLALTQKLRESGKPMPRALVLVSPWTDASFSQLPQPNNDALLTTTWVQFTRGGFVSEAQWKDPKVSPVFADFNGFPPTLIQSSSAELLANDAARLNDAMSQAKVKVEWQEFEGLWHDFQLNAGLVPEADQAVAQIADFLKTVI
ncbi:alpha/beta hydrolase [Limnobacter litoralis]|uniref:Esterase n=1 Tax=Limnobacter litoralis TaxID=481366 RepID=A0ABQ5YPA4_9BURK|nr:alpha/beta hydrolase [Limnobacter litoralis]GLR25311.1 esterase [Limnobacter litoralis]